MASTTTPRKTTAKKQTAKKQTAAKAAKVNPFDEFRKSFDHHMTVDVYGKWMLSARFHELNEAAASIAESVGVDDKYAVQAAREASALRDEIEASKVEVKVRCLTTGERLELARKVGLGDDDYDFRYDQLAAQVSEPRLTAEQWREAETWMGPHFTRIVAAANMLVDDEGVVPDFSPTTSAVLAAANSLQDSESPEPTASGTPSS